MLNPIGSVGGPNSQTHGEGGEDEPEGCWNNFFRFRPIRFYQSLAAEIDSRETSKAKRDYLTDMIRRTFYRGTRSPWVGPLVILVALGFIAWLCAGPNTQTSDIVVAVFSIVAGVATGLGWWAMNDQNKIMREQQAQTDEIIKHMRAERRGWLSATTHRFDHSDLSELPEFKFVFENNGDSPCTVTEFRFGLGVDADIDKAARDARANMLVRKMTEIGCAVVPPRGKTGQTSWPDVTIQPDERRAIEARQARYVIAFRFRYATAGAEDCETAQMIAYYTANGDISICGNLSDNYMR